jgi:pimeloyl-ACP methyl ester carboxylesterase
MAAPTEGTTRAGAASIRWRRTGTGPDLVFLHGFPLSGHTWDAVVARLRDRFTCWTLDLVGLGESHSTSDADHASPGQARAFASTLDALGVGAYALVGNDTGGWIARELALVDGRRVGRLVLTNTEIPGHRPPWIPLYQVLAELPGAGTVLRQFLKLRAYRRSPLAFGGCFHDLSHLDGDFHDRYVVPLLTSHARIDGAMRFLRCMKFTRLDEFATLHRQLTMPTLFIWGADDPTFPEARARAMLPQFPNVAGFHSVANGKLFFYEEHPGEVARLIDRFLSPRREDEHAARSEP